MSYNLSTYTVSDVLMYVKRQFGDESAIQVSDSDILRWINIGQLEIFRRNEPIKSTVKTDLVGGTHTYTFPVDILRLQAIYVNGYPVPQKSTQDAEEHILQNDPNRVATGQPSLWYEWGGQFTFWPTPETTAPNGIELRYVKTPAKLTATTSTLVIPDVYYSRLLEFVMSQAYELDENFAAADSKTAQFSQNLESIVGSEVVSNTYPTITVLESDW